MTESVQNQEPKAPAPAASHANAPALPTLAENLWHQRALIILCVLLAAAAALVIGIFSPRKFEARVTVLAEPRKEYDPQQPEIRTQQERAAFLETQKEIVVSRSVIAETLAALRQKSPESITPAQVEMFQNSISVSSRAGLGRNLFSGNGIGESNTFFVTVRAESANEAARQANTLIEKYLEVSKRLRAGSAQTALSVLQASTGESTRRIESAQTQMATLEESAGVLLPNLIDADKPTLPTFPELKEIRTEYESERAKLEQLRVRVQHMKSSLESSGSLVVPSDLAVDNEAVKTLQTRLAELQVEAAKQVPFFQESSRELKSLRDQIRIVEQLLRDEIKKFLASEEQRLLASERAQESRSKTLAEYDERVTSFSHLNSKYMEARRLYQAQAKANQALIEGLATVEIAAADRSAQTANITIIDKAIPDPRPVAPRVGRNVLLAGLLGFVVGLLFALLRLPPTLPAPGGRRATD